MTQGVKETLSFWRLSTSQRCFQRATRLNEQGASDERTGEYWTRLLRWLQAGISDDIPQLALPLSYLRAMGDQPLHQYRLMLSENFSYTQKYSESIDKYPGILASHNTAPYQKNRPLRGKD
jgi:hypothetical protein